MNASTDVPVMTTLEAEARIAELGMRKEVEQMIDYVRTVTPGLTAIEVTVAECYDSREEPGVSITGCSDQVFEPGNTVSWDSLGWMARTFPPQVLEHLCILFSPGKPNAG